LGGTTIVGTTIAWIFIHWCNAPSVPPCLINTAL